MMKRGTALIAFGSLGLLLWWLSKQVEAAPPPEVPPEPPPEPPPGKALLMVDTTPIKGSIFVNGVYQGIAPLTLELDPGTYIVSFGGITGYITPPPQTITLIEGGTAEMSATYSQMTPLPPPPEPGSLEGYITDAMTGSPVARVSVGLLKGGKWRYTARTSAEGIYLMPQIAPDTYFLYCYDYTTRYYAPEGKRITIQSGKRSRADLTVVSMDYGRVYGFAYDGKTGTPLEGILVEVLAQDFSTYTNSKGYYETGFLRTGTFVFRFSDPSGRYETADVSGEIKIWFNPVSAGMEQRLQ